MSTAQIRIIKPPPGEAPAEIRAAWVGIILPLASKAPATIETFGVLSIPKTRIGLAFAKLLGRMKRQTGYIVEANKGIELLAVHAPEAALWWRKYAARAIAPGQFFLFAIEACEEIAN